MTRQLTTATAYIIGNHLVTLSHLLNDRNGNLRYQAEIVNLEYAGKCKNAAAFRYTFTGHYFSEPEEAKWILAHHLKNVA